MGHERGLLHCISIVLVCVACRLGAADAAAVPVPASAPPFSDQDAPQRAPAPAPGTAELSEALPPAMQGSPPFGVALPVSMPRSCGSQPWPGELLKSVVHFLLSSATGLPAIVTPMMPPNL